MSMPRQIPVTCKQCAKEHPFTAWESLNVTLDRKAKDQLLKGDLTRFECPDCGWSGNVVYPMLYHDMEKHFMIWLWTESGDLEPTSVPPTQLMRDDYRFRIVGTCIQLIEKVRVFDTDLDDRLLELFKFLLQVQASQGDHPLLGEILFGALERSENGAQSISFEHLTEAGSECLAFPMQAYQRVVGSLTSLLPSRRHQVGQWLRVDRAFAESLVRRLL
jgi:hypothetical protein